MKFKIFAKLFTAFILLVIAGSTWILIVPPLLNYPSWFAFFLGISAMVLAIVPAATAVRMISTLITSAKIIK